MSETIVYGFPRSTFVNIVRLVLTHKDVPYTFQDLEAVMGKPEHLALHRSTAFRSSDIATSLFMRQAPLSPTSTRRLRGGA
jgi:hypothetical protein